MFKQACLWYGVLAGVIGALGGTGCKSKTKSTDSKPTILAEAPSARPAAQGLSSAAPTRSFVVPSGPAFAIQAGVGLGPVRFGATVATIERLMGSKCDELTEKFCRYIPAGIEYDLSEGVVSGIIVYRHDRAVVGSPGKTWGRTRCAILPDITPRVILSYVHSNLGAPQSSEPVNGANPNRTALRETYPGLVLEYDRGEYTQELVLGSIRVVKLDKLR
jgi:hypothetical protein